MKSAKEVQLFEFIQQDLELNRERLHELLERNKDTFIDTEDATNSAFFKYKSELSGISIVIRKFHQSFNDGITHGLSSGSI